MVKFVFDSGFKRKFKKIKDKILIKQIINQIDKLSKNPKAGKPMKYTRKGTRELYIKPFRLSYRADKNFIYILDLYNTDSQWALLDLGM